MDYRFKSKKLEALFTSKKGAKRYPEGVVSSFFRVMTIIASATDVQDFIALKSRRFEKLCGDREGQYSMRLNDQYRLILEIREEAQRKYLLIVEIVDYH
ncbi:type II toxin-antitoxin system RelE/ParE family toxin [Leptolyngbya sp. 7M]|nr:type II toxin-antitoxin system RelE/ParE family toxin [Leptolyngbya sp. 7M]QYO64441.1 type II toxin-antitoxin system RelE/ParE family toxin [Leptolyngbya sp. 7M]